jgi:hypothetical protein
MKQFLRIVLLAVVIGSAQVIPLSASHAPLPASPVPLPAQTIWLRVATSGPSPRYGMAMAYDVARDRVVLFGGGSGRYPPAIYYYDDTWEFNGATATWTQRGTTTIPGDTIFAQAIWNANRGHVMMFGGETWITPSGPQPPGTACGLAGLGLAPDYYLQNKLWEWTGTNWSQLPPATPWPEERCGHGLAYDADYQTPVLYGGLNYNGYASNTWEWHDPGWIEYTSANGPGPRLGVGMVFHPGLVRNVLFGGVYNGTYYNNTWLWGGARTDWVNANAGTPPAARSDMAFTYDSGQARVVLYGGHNASTLFSDTWAWTGAGNWTQLPIAGAPGGRYAAAMVYDSARARLVLFGGASATGQYGDTWVTHTYTPAYRVFLPAAVR